MASTMPDLIDFRDHTVFLRVYRTTKRLAPFYFYCTKSGGSRRSQPKRDMMGRVNAPTIRPDPALASGKQRQLCHATLNRFMPLLPRDTLSRTCRRFEQNMSLMGFSSPLPYGVTGSTADRNEIMRSLL